MLANCLRCVSAPVSECDRLTSHDASPGLRNTNAGSRLMSSPLRERAKRPPAFAFRWIGCVIDLFCELHSGLFFALARSRLSQRFRGFERRPPSVGARAVAYRFTAVVRTVLEFPVG